MFAFVFLEISQKESRKEDVQRSEERLQGLILIT